MSNWPAFLRPAPPRPSILEPIVIASAGAVGGEEAADVCEVRQPW